MKKRYVRQPAPDPKTRKELSSISRELRALQTLPLAALLEQHTAVCGYTVRTNNRDALIKKLAWKVQANVEGGLSDKAHAKIADLVPGGVPTTWKGKGQRAAKHLAPGMPRKASAQLARRPELPAPGTVIECDYNGKPVRFTVDESDFEYEGNRYATPSALALAITGTKWNGYAFLRMMTKQSKNTKPSK